MRQVFLWVVSSLCCFVSSTSQVYYITPDQPDPQGNCSVDGTILSPCYTLQQVNSLPSSSKEGSVELLLLPGTHLVAVGNKINVTLSNFKVLVIHPWNEEQEVAIKCAKLPPNGWHIPDLNFRNINELTIFSLNLSSCLLHYGYDLNSKTERSVDITKCFFEKGRIVIKSTESDLNITISNCTFSSNNGPL